MHAIYPTPEEVWRDYVHGEEPREFVARLGGSTAEACVAAHLDTLPDVYGIVRARGWHESFSRPWQLRRHEVAMAMLAYLQGREDSWLDALRVEQQVTESSDEEPSALAAPDEQGAAVETESEREAFSMETTEEHS
jgi:hypothetical protein